MRDQESLLEAFKSGNALLRNSMDYLGHVLGRAGAGDGNARDVAMVEIGAVANALVGFMQEPQGDAATAFAAEP